jgi:hypothetical protein
LDVRASSPLIVTVTVPLSATDGLTDSVRVMLSGTDVIALAQLITTADVPYSIYLPLIRKD